MVRTTWPLCGRDDEIAHLSARLRHGRGALLAGPSGVGKTSLASGVAAELEPEGWALVRLVASRPAAGIPLGVLAGLLTPGDLPGDSVPALLQARSGVAAIAAGRPSAVVLDDAQWVDEASAVVLHQLVAQGDITLLATLRTGEPAPDPVTALWKDGLVERVDVAPLGDESVRDLLEAVLEGPVETLTATRLWGRCAGNALYLRELVGEAVRLGLLQRREGLWCIDTLPPGSARLAELVGERFGALDEHERAALEVVAIGEPIGLGMLDELADRAAVERLEAAGVIAIDTDGEHVVARPAHPLYGDVVRSSLPELGRRRLTRTLADALERRGATGRDDSIRLALWRLDGGGTAAPGLLLAAARHAHFAFDGATAERLSRAAWAADHAFEAARILADVLFARGGFVEREQLLADLAATVTTDEERAVAAVSRALGLFWGLADGEAAERVLVEAEADVTDPQWWSEIRAAIGRHWRCSPVCRTPPSADAPGSRPHSPRPSPFQESAEATKPSPASTPPSRPERRSASNSRCFGSACCCHRRPWRWCPLAASTTPPRPLASGWTMRSPPGTAPPKGSLAPRLVGFSCTKDCSSPPSAPTARARQRFVPA